MKFNYFRATVLLVALFIVKSGRSAEGDFSTGAFIGYFGAREIGLRVRKHGSSRPITPEKLG